MTLIELLVAVSILGILLAVAVPSWSDATLGGQLRNQANSFSASALLARTEAIKRNRSVALCVSGTGTACTAGSWEDGYIVIVGSTVLLRQPRLPAGLRMSSDSGVVRYDFPAQGFGLAADSLVLCRAEPSDGPQERVIDLESSGRVRVTRTTEGQCP